MSRKRSTTRRRVLWGISVLILVVTTVAIWTFEPFANPYISVPTHLTREGDFGHREVAVIENAPNDETAMFSLMENYNRLYPMGSIPARRLFVIQRKAYWFDALYLADPVDYTDPQTRIEDMDNMDFFAEYTCELDPKGDTVLRVTTFSNVGIPTR